MLYQELRWNTESFLWSGPCLLLQLHHLYKFSSTLYSRLTELLSTFEKPWSFYPPDLVQTVLSAWKTLSNFFNWISPTYSLGLNLDVTLTSETLSSWCLLLQQVYRSLFAILPVTSRLKASWSRNQSILSIIL